MATTDDPLKRYQIMEPVGAGAQGHTFRGVDRDTGRMVAIKVLSLGKLEGWKRFDLFEREVAVLEGLRHPGIPRYIDHYSSEKTGDYFLVMELVEGRTLRELIQAKRTLEPGQLRSLLEQALDILEYLHELSPPVVHRDVKPANLIRGHDGRLSLVDFGGVRLAVQPEGGSTMIGTFGYMAPEQLHGQATAATDLYSLGATLAALWAGREADQLVRDGLTIDLDAIAPPPWLRTVLEGMLEPDPRERLRTVAEVRKALAQTAAPREHIGPKRTRGAVGESAKQGASTQALVPVSSTMRGLSKTPPPFSVLVWLFMALGAGVLVVVEAVMLPLLHAAIGRWHASHSDDERRQAFEEEHRRLLDVIRTHRRTLSWVATQTHPIKD
jgi:serine/threonine protein kinase